MKHKGTVTIETDRIILRRFLTEDVNAAFYNWMSDEKVTEFLRWRSHPNIGASKRVINEWIDNYKNEIFISGRLYQKILMNRLAQLRQLRLMKQ